MISVIVPTMWNFEPFLDYVKDLVKLPIIGEVIIFDNDTSKTPDRPDVLTHDKVKHIKCDRNIYVNPAWNLGANFAQGPMLCFLNDDVIVDLKVFYRVADMLTSDVGVVGISPGNVEFGQEPFRDGSIEIVEWDKTPDEMFHGCRFGFGCLFFVHKDNWTDIPAGIDIYFGDDWVFDLNQLVKRKPIYLINNSLFYTPYATTTSKTDYSEIYKRDFEKYMPYFNSMTKEYYK